MEGKRKEKVEMPSMLELLSRLQNSFNNHNGPTLRKNSADDEISISYGGTPITIKYDEEKDKDRKSYSFTLSYHPSEKDVVESELVSVLNALVGCSSCCSYEAGSDPKSPYYFYYKVWSIYPMYSVGKNVNELGSAVKNLHTTYDDLPPLELAKKIIKVADHISNLDNYPRKDKMVEYMESLLLYLSLLATCNGNTLDKNSETLDFNLLLSFLEEQAKAAKDNGEQISCGVTREIIKTHLNN